jgi:uncharacterized protein (TIGR02266 family)
MPAERRRGPRTRIDAVHVTCEGASGERARGRGLDLGEGGLFVQVDKLPAVGAPLSLSVHLAGEPAPWAARGRVVWVRELASKDGEPRGMGIAFVDLDDAARAAIARVLARAGAAGGSGGRVVSGPPSRERTVLGVGLATPHRPVAAAPIVAVAPPRERTALGIAPVAAPLPRTPPAPVADDLPDWPDEPPEPEMAAAPAVEQSVPIELTAAKARAPSPQREGAPSRPPEVAREVSITHPAGVPRKGRAARFLLVLLLLGAAAGGGYVERAPLRAWLSPYVGRALAHLPRLPLR